MYDYARLTREAFDLFDLLDCALATRRYLPCHLYGRPIATADAARLARVRALAGRRLDRRDASAPPEWWTTRAG